MSKKRIFICAERRFPRGDAGGNLVLYLAKALQKADNEVIVLSIGQSEQQFYDSEKGLYEYSGINYLNVLIRNNLLKKFDENIFSGWRTISLLKRLHITKEDKIIIYSSNAIYTQILQNFVYKRKKCTTFMEIVEYFQYNQFRGGFFSPKYLLYLYCFNFLYPRTKNVIAISNFLKDKFERRHCNVFRLPLIIDVEDYKLIKKVNEHKINLIYSGNPGKKEAFLEMLLALTSLSTEDRKRIILNITGVSKSVIEKLLSDKKYILDELDNIIVFHKWMNYEELLKLYGKMDFLFFVRNNSIITKANFPSKVPELMACGVVPAVNRIGDFSDILTDKYDSVIEDGFTVNTCITILNRILNLDSEEIRSMSDNTKSTVKKTLDLNIWTTQLSDFIRGTEYR